jgi:hypothetical protein
LQIIPQYPLLVVILYPARNSLIAIMSGPGAGFEYPSKEVSWLKRDVLLFAASIGVTADELHFLYVCLDSLRFLLYYSDNL